MNNILGLIKACKNKNLLKVESLVEKELETRIFKLIESEKEDLLKDSDESDDTEHQEKFRALLATYNVDSIDDLSDEETSKFFADLKKA